MSPRVSSYNLKCTRTSVCDVPEFAFPVELDEVREEGFLYQVGMQFCNAIHSSGPDDCEVGHSDLLGEALCKTSSKLTTME